MEYEEIFYSVTQCLVDRLQMDCSLGQGQDFSSFPVRVQDIPGNSISSFVILCKKAKNILGINGVLRN